MADSKKPKKAVAKKAASKKPATKKIAVKKPAKKKAVAKQAANKATAPVQPNKYREPENLQEHIDKALAMNNLAKTDSHLVYKILKAYFDPQLIGLENIDKDKPSLFAGNHCMWGFEGGFVPSAIHAETGMMPRLLTDGNMIMTPLEDTLIKLGQVLAHPKVCSALMEAGQSIMVFPGGALEGAKKRGEQYKLMWENRLGFVRMAIQHGFSITPFATIGPDEMWDVRWDSDDIDNNVIGKLLNWIDSDRYDPKIIPIFPKGLAGSLIPRPERFYIAFGKPVDLSQYAGMEGDKNILLTIKNDVEAQLNELIKDTLVERSRRRDEMHWLRKRLTRH